MEYLNVPIGGSTATDPETVAYHGAYARGYHLEHQRQGGGVPDCRHQIDIDGVRLCIGCVDANAVEGIPDDAPMGLDAEEWRDAIGYGKADVDVHQCGCAAPNTDGPSC